MANSARLRQLGLPDFIPNGLRIAANSKDNNKTNERNREDADYDPLHDDTDEQDLCDDDIAKGSKGKTSKKTKKQTSDAPPMGVKFRSHKRVYAALTTGPWSNRSISQPGPSLAPSDIHVPPPSHPAISQAVGPADQDDGPDAMLQANGHNNFANTDGFDLHDGADVGAQPVGVNQMTNEGGEVPWNRGTNMGHGLNRLNRSHRAKLPIVIPEGQIRPLVPLIAAKYATEINIAVRNHMPVLTHWKEYKGRAEIEEFLGILRAKFNIDTNDAVVKNGCLEMMRNAVRNQRHRLKKEFFDTFPLHLVPKTSPVKSTSDKEWLDLVEMWKTPKKMMICQKNKDNRGNVLLHQTTGSCSYAVFVENLEDENEDENTERNAFNLFKMCHFSKKKDGYTPAVQSAITQMETQLAAQPTQGEQPKSAVQVVANVLERNNKKSAFLQNVGMQTKRPRMSAQLEAEKRENAKFRLIVSNQREQMEGLSKQVQETELTRIRDKEEMSKKQAELEAKLELVLGPIGVLQLLLPLLLESNSKLF
ncbi:uncharacterized protein LOC112900579 [Panicum hallii]|uniref:uncharacterized protein LOC112900579 n=1 Tax=Panicum hallii TaxID=206008 RepID=UPI000DF4DFE5|nr:uncharacterized protein LOC112900579 [Panicum hallii]